MDRRSKHWIAVTMWIALASFLVAIILNTAVIPEAWMLLPLTMVPLTFGVFVTLALWSPIVFPWIDAERLRAIQPDTADVDQSQNKKRKRGQDSASQPSDIQALLNLMDHDEREEFKDELKRRILNNATVGDDGEISYRGLALSDLLEDEQASRQDQM